MSLHVKRTSAHLDSAPRARGSRGRVWRQYGCLHTCYTYLLWQSTARSSHACHGVSSPCPSWLASISRSFSKERPGGT
eukprot:2066-Chlamydomonas_euryale.AAC.3